MTTVSPIRSPAGRTAPATTRTPPHSLEAEQSVLGGLMLVSEAWDQVADRVVAEDFYRREHRLIYRAISDLIADNQPCDAVTLGEWFERHGETASIGGGAYLAELANNTPSAANIKAYADIVRDKSVLRKLIEAGTQIASDGFNPEGRTAEEILSAAEGRLLELGEANSRGRTRMVSSRDGMRDYLAVLQHRHDHPGMTGITTGFRELDELTEGLQRQDLVIVAGRPSMGKTAFALNIACTAALRAKQPVLVFSLEMSTEKLFERATAAVARVKINRLRQSAVLDAEEWERVTAAAAMLDQARIFIDDTPALSPSELRSRARRAKREHGLGMIVVDYLQLMRVPGMKAGDRVAEVSEISRSLKALAKELDVPVIALSQLNRALEQRNDKRPIMSDLRESGAIEQDADLILFVYRDDVYDKNSRDRGVAEVIVGKQRNGPVGTVRLLYHGDFTKFDNQPVQP